MNKREKRKYLKLACVRYGINMGFKKETDLSSNLPLPLSKERYLKLSDSVSSVIKCK